MTLAISPQGTIKVAQNITQCLNASSIISIPAVAEHYANFPTEITIGSDTCTIYDSSIGYWRKNCGANSVYDAETVEPSSVYHLQPFYIVGINGEFVGATPGPPNNDVDLWIGAQSTDDSWWFFWQVSKYCNSDPTDCSSDWLARTVIKDPSNTLTYGSYITVNFHEEFRIRSDGFSLYYERRTGGVWVTHFTHPNPTDALDYDLFVNGYFVGNNWTAVRTWRGSYQGPIPTTWTVDPTATLDVNANQACFTSSTLGDYTVCVDNQFDDLLCVNIEVDPLYFTPVGFGCDSCIFTGTIVDFESNSAGTGVLSATGGTVLSNESWKAPDEPGIFSLTYTVGETVLHCQFTVVPPINLLETSSTIQAAPGQVFDISTNYNYPDIVWESLGDCNIITPQGFVSIPTVYTNDCFGALECTVRGTLQSVGEGCVVPTSDGNFIDVVIKVNPIYPAVNQCGPPHVKWLRNTITYKVLSVEMEGGCDERHIKNRTGIYRWTIDYNGLPYDIETEPCNPCEAVGLTVRPDCPEYLKTAKRLDDFWEFVNGTFGSFTLIDHETGETWYNVSFEKDMTTDHSNKFTARSRGVNLIWRPCCATRGKKCKFHL